MSDTLKAVIFDAATGELIERELNADELAQRQIHIDAVTAEKTEQDATAKARTSALAKLKKLGLTDKEIAAL